MPRPAMLLIVLLAATGCVLGTAGCSLEEDGAPIGTGLPSASPGSSAAPVPGIGVDVVARGLEHVWDIGFLPDGSALITERPARIKLLSATRPGATVTEVAADLGDVYVRGEGGLMGLVVHPDFAQTRRFTTCQTHQEGGRPVDVRLVTWELSGDGRRASRVADPLVGGLPLNPSGRHSGCRPTLGPDGYLYVGTGDSAMAAVAQDRSKLGGKVLRVELGTGAGAPDNPFAGASNAAERLIFSYGHRNVQGVAVQPGTGRLFVAEHGPDVDDEINVLRAGGNYGWDPSQGGTERRYDESVPMTDLQRFPDAVSAVWSSGGETEAICGAAFLDSAQKGDLQKGDLQKGDLQKGDLQKGDLQKGDLQWGDLQGVLAVSALKGTTLLLMRVGSEGTVTDVGRLPQLDGTHGRLRAVRTGPDGALYVTTSNGADDQVLRVAPVGS